MNTSIFTTWGGNFAWEGRTFGRTGGVLWGAVGSAGDAGPSWLVTEVDRVGGVTSGVSWKFRDYLASLACFFGHWR